MASEDADAAMLLMLDRLGQIEDKAKRIATIREVFGEEGAGPVLSIVNEVETLRKTYADLNAGIAAGSIDKEFARQTETAKFSIQSFQSALTDLKAALGESLLPMIKVLTGAFQTFADTVERFPNVGRIVVGGLAGLVAAPFIAAGIGLLSMAMGTLTRAAGLLGAPLFAAGRALGLMSVALGGVGRGAAQARRSLSAMAWRLPGLALLAALGATLAASWEPIRDLFSDLAPAVSSVGDAIGSALAGDWEAASASMRLALDEAREAFGRFVDAVSVDIPGFGRFVEAVGRLGAAVGGLFTSLMAGGNADLSSFLAAMERAASIVLDAFAAALNLVASALEAVNRAVSAFMTAPDWLSGLQDAIAVEPGIMALAAALGAAGLAGAVSTLAGAFRAMSTAGGLAGIVAALRGLPVLRLAAIGLALYGVADAAGVLEGVDFGSIAGGVDTLALALGGLLALKGLGRLATTLRGLGAGAATVGAGVAGGASGVGAGAAAATIAGVTFLGASIKQMGEDLFAAVTNIFTKASEEEEAARDKFWADAKARNDASRAERGLAPREDIKLSEKTDSGWEFLNGFIKVGELNLPDPMEPIRAIAAGMKDAGQDTADAIAKPMAGVSRDLSRGIVDGGRSAGAAMRSDIESAELRIDDGQIAAFQKAAADMADAMAPYRADVQGALDQAAAQMGIAPASAPTFREAENASMDALDDQRPDLDVMIGDIRAQREATAAGNEKLGEVSSKLDALSQLATLAQIAANTAGLAGLPDAIRQGLAWSRAQAAPAAGSAAPISSGGMAAPETVVVP